MDLENLKASLARSLLEVKLDGLDSEMIVRAMDVAAPGKVAELIDGLKADDPGATGDSLNDILFSFLLAQADVEAQEIIDGDALTLEQADRLIGAERQRRHKREQRVARSRIPMPIIPPGRVDPAPPAPNPNAAGRGRP